MLRSRPGLAGKGIVPVKIKHTVRTEGGRFMGRPKKEKYEIEERFLTEALLLAGSYSDAVKEKKQLQDLMMGEFEYTEDMAIQDLIWGGQQEGERVQTSNISNIPERAAILLADGYVEKQKYRMQKEAQRRMDEYRKLCGQVEIVETAMNERMDDRTRAVFVQFYVEHRKKCQIVDEYSCQLYRSQVERAMSDAIDSIAEELAYREFIDSCEREEGV